MSYEGVVKADSPKGYWRLGEPSGTEAADSSGNSQKGEYKSSPTLGAGGAIVGDSNRAVTLNGSSQYVNVADSATIDLGDVFTYEVWIKRSRTGALNDALFDKGSGAAIIRFDSGTANKLLFRRNSVANISTATVEIADTTTWHHVVVTKNGATVKMWIDGVDRTGTVTNSTCVSTALPLTIGNDDAADFFGGSMDEAAIYATALSEARVKAHYNAGRAGRRFNLLGVGS